MIYGTSSGFSAIDPRSLATCTKMNKIYTVCFGHLRSYKWILFDINLALILVKLLIRPLDWNMMSGMNIFNHIGCWVNAASTERCFFHVTKWQILVFHTFHRLFLNKCLNDKADYKKQYKPIFLNFTSDSILKNIKLKC